MGGGLGRGALSQNQSPCQGGKGHLFQGEQRPNFEGNKDNIGGKQIFYFGGTQGNKKIYFRYPYTTHFPRGSVSKGV